VVSRALRLILEGGLDTDNIESFAERVGIGPRHLRRLFAHHVGTSPVRIAQLGRAHLAKSLIEETDLPLGEIALRAGFKSIRQFNQVLRTAYECSPSRMRRRPAGIESARRDNGIVIHLPYDPPFDWQAFIEFLQPRATPGVEEIDADIYRRTITIDEDTGDVEVSPDGPRPRLRVRVRLTNYTHLVPVVNRVRQMFDLSADPAQTARHLSQDSLLKSLLNAHPGLRVPGVWDGFELAIKTMLGESLTTSGATEAVARLVAIFGRAINSGGKLAYLFPSAPALATAELSRAGLCDEHILAIGALATAVCGKRLVLEPYEPPPRHMSRLFEIPGMDELKAAYIMMRAAGDPDAFPLRDGETRVLLGLSTKAPSAGKFLSITERWRPWRAYAAMHLVMRRRDAGMAKTDRPPTLTALSA
jgi:AraC family transcriptional regulator of adaptative response / DNA-3-methyladenine glycosylase II